VARLATVSPRMGHSLWNRQNIRARGVTQYPEQAYIDCTVWFPALKHAIVLATSSGAAWQVAACISQHAAAATAIRKYGTCDIQRSGNPPIP
jgi:hypothetical protein